MVPGTGLVVRSAFPPYRGSRSVSVAFVAPQRSQTDLSRLSSTAKYWSNAQHRPNIHTGLHYEEEAVEFGTPFNSNALAGEDMHK